MFLFSGTAETDAVVMAWATRAANDGCAFAIRVRQQNSEFIAAIARDGAVPVGNLVQCAPDRGDQRIAGQMTEVVVHVLEVIQIEHDHRARRRVSRRLLKAREHRPTQVPIVVEAGQLIVVCQLLQADADALSPPSPTSPCRYQIAAVAPTIAVATRATSARTSKWRDGESTPSAASPANSATNAMKGATMRRAPSCIAGVSLGRSGVRVHHTVALPPAFVRT